MKGGIEPAVQGLDIVGAAVGEAGLGVRPHPLVGVELGGAGWEVLKTQTRVAAVSRSTIRAPRRWRRRWRKKAPTSGWRMLWRWQRK
jgi:hypothetical protein